MVKHSFYDDLITKQIYTDGFKCPHFEECSGSMEPNNKLKFYRTRIGSKYDEEQIKILVVGQEDVGEGKKYTCCEPCTMEEAGYNPHYLKTFYSVAQILLDDKDLPKGYNKDDMSQSKYENLRHSFSLTNYYKCVFSDSTNNSGVNHSKAMEKYCSEHLIKEIEMLKPDILILQGKGHPTFWKRIKNSEVEKAERKSSINNKNYKLRLYEAIINDKRTYIVDSYHPTARGNIWGKTSEGLSEILRIAKELCNVKGEL